MLPRARAFASKPAPPLLDELSMLVLQLLIVEGLYDTVTEIAEQGVSILVVEQFASRQAVLHLRGSHAGWLVIAFSEPGRRSVNQLSELYLEERREQAKGLGRRVRFGGTTDTDVAWPGNCRFVACYSVVATASVIHVRGVRAGSTSRPHRRADFCYLLPPL